MICHNIWSTLSVIIFRLDEAKVSYHQAMYTSLLAIREHNTATAQAALNIARWEA